MLSSDNEKYLDGVEKMVSMTDRLTKLQDEIAAMQPKLQVGAMSFVPISMRSVGALPPLQHGLQCD